MAALLRAACCVLPAAAAAAAAASINHRGNVGMASPQQVQFQQVPAWALCWIVCLIAGHELKTKNTQNQLLSARH